MVFAELLNLPLELGNGAMKFAKGLEKPARTSYLSETGGYIIFTNHGLEIVTLECTPEHTVDIGQSGHRNKVVLESTAQTV